MQKLIAVVPVRAGSKGFPGKNTQILEGTPLYLRAALQGARTTGRSLISTDIDEILQSEPPAHIEASRRPDQLSADYTPMESVVAHVIESERLHEYAIVLLQATSPLRRDSDILQAIELYNSGCHDLVMSVVKKDKGILKYGTLEDGCFKAVRDPSYCFQNRQQLPEVYAPNGAIYVFSASKFLENNCFPTSNIGVVFMSDSDSLDIDTEKDFKIAIDTLHNT